MANIALLNTSHEVVQFNTKSGVSELSTEAALFKGGAALASLKDMALDVAFSKAVSGRYRATCDILMVAFPTQHKAYSKLFKNAPWANKTEMASYLHAMELAEPGKSGEFNKKQQAARALLRAVRQIPAFRPADAGEVVADVAVERVDELAFPEIDAAAV